MASCLTDGLTHGGQTGNILHINHSGLEYLEFNPNIFEFLPNLLLFIGSGIFGYLALAYLIDERTRKIFLSNY